MGHAFGTSIGIERSRYVPSPSCPALLLPQHLSEPAVVRAFVTQALRDEPLVRVTTETPLVRDAVEGVDDPLVPPPEEDAGLVHVKHG